MSIFDEIPRKDVATKPADETQFAYLNRSARPEAARVRENIDAWLAKYPEGQRESLVSRLRSVIDDQHRSAFFELFLLQLLEARGCKVIAIEPRLDHTDKSPDFLVHNAEQQPFYVEAVLATGLSNHETAAQARLNTALSAIDNTPSPNHFLDLTVVGNPERPLSGKKLGAGLKSWIASLPTDETAREAAPFIWEEIDREAKFSGQDA